METNIKSKLINFLSLGLEETAELEIPNLKDEGTVIIEGKKYKSVEIKIRHGEKNVKLILVVIVND